MYGEINPAAVLTQVGVERIKDLRQSGRSIAAIAGWLQVGKTTVANVLRGHRWLHGGSQP
jgi:hypothetical protein